MTLDRLDPPADAPARVRLPQDGVTVIHFFATWCEPCRRELPALAALAETRAARVVLVDVAEPEARIRRFFETVPAPGMILLDRDRAASHTYGISVLPASLVAVNGVARLRATGPVDWTDPEVRGQIHDITPPAVPSGVSLQQ